MKKSPNMDLHILDMNYSHKRKIRMTPAVTVKRMLVEISRLSEISAIASRRKVLKADRMEGEREGR